MLPEVSRKIVEKDKGDGRYGGEVERNGERNIKKSNPEVWIETVVVGKESGRIKERARGGRRPLILMSFSPAHVFAFHSP